MTRLLASAIAASLITTALATGTASAGQAASDAPALAPLIGPGGTAISVAAAQEQAAEATATENTKRTAAIVKDSYIVVLRAGGQQGQTRASEQRAQGAGGRIGHTFSSIFAGYSATLSSSELDQVRRDPAVKYVQTNLRYRLAGSTQKHVESWGLDRIDQRTLPLNEAYYYNTTGKGVSVYVVDTGIEADHPDFTDVRSGIDLVGTSNGGVDCNGHGTHVAGTIGGTYFGVAKQVSLYPVRVLDCSGGGDQDNILAGLDWVRANHTGPSVANLSIETVDADFDTTLDTAVQSLIASGVTVVAAAGNGEPRGVDACTVSPASAPNAITVGASTIGDAAASFSNYGPCVDIYAPGEGITSDWPKDSHGTYRVAILDGTSMAAPHVSGTAALYLQAHPAATPAQVSAYIRASATAGKITGVNPKYPHDLLFSPQTVTVPAGVTTGDRLSAGQSLVRGARLYSAGQTYFLAHRSRDGWLCLYQSSTGRVVWSSGHSSVWTNLSAAGSLGSYDSYGRRAWTTGAGLGASTMIVNAKGYLVIRRDADGKVTWTSPH